MNPVWRDATCAAFDVRFLQLNTKGVDALKSQYCVLKTVIYHADEGHFVIQDGSNLLESSLTLVSSTATIEIPSNLAVKFVMRTLQNPFAN